MYCSQCGKEIVNDARFCCYCGSPLSPNVTREKREEKTQIFRFNSLTYNSDNVSEINAWLHANAINIKTVSISTFMNRNIPIKWETVIGRMEITYEEVKTDRRYTLGHFKAKKWFGADYSIVESALEEWQRINSDLRVVWKKYAGHQADGGSTQSVYFLYL